MNDQLHIVNVVRLGRSIHNTIIHLLFSYYSEQEMVNQRMIPSQLLFQRDLEDLFINHLQYTTN